MNKRKIEFCKQYIVDLNGKQAAIRAGYAASRAEVTACELLKREDVRSYIQSLMDKRSSRLEITQDMVLRELAKIGFSDISEFAEFKDVVHENPFYKELTPEQIKKGEIQTQTKNYTVRSVVFKPFDKISKDKLGVISEIGEKKNNSGTTVFLKFHDKLKALEDIAKHIGFFEKDNEQKATQFNLSGAVSSFMKPDTNAGDA